MNLTILICNYNTPQLVLNLLKSLSKVLYDKPKVLVINTSTDNKSSKILSDHGIKYIDLPGETHGNAVNFGLCNVTTTYILLVDSDVLFLKPIDGPYKVCSDKDLTLMGRIVGNIGGKTLMPRVEPWYCFMNREHLVSRDILFFDSKRSGNITAYDVGSSMFEDVTMAGLLIGHADIEDKYFKHYGGMSWRTQKYDPSNEDTNIDLGGTHPHKQYYDWGLQVKAQYDKDTEYLNFTNIVGLYQ